MRLYSIFGIIAALSCLQNAMAQDTIWACREDTAEIMYFKMYNSDTFPDNRGKFEMVDTTNSEIPIPVMRVSSFTGTTAWCSFGLRNTIP
jgi:hypothetical protein